MSIARAGFVVGCLSVLVFANSGAGMNESLQVEDMGEVDQREPRYRVSPSARDPFFPPRKEGEDDGEEKTTLEQVRRSINLSGLMGTDARSGTALINGRVYKPGDAIVLEIGGQKLRVAVNRLEMNPPAVVLVFEEQEFVVELNPED
ncbi:MAG: hypothetical protein K9N51_05285 [Candidatus Pacebacteria bacterium]|nr:hypothetical protein [Candidatus Paceibacterota bacterium]